MTYSSDERPGFWWYAAGDGKAYSVVVAKTYNELMKGMARWIADGVEESESIGEEWGEYLYNNPSSVWVCSDNEELTNPDFASWARGAAMKDWDEFRKAVAYCVSVVEVRNGEYLRSAEELKLPEDLYLELDAWAW